MNKDRMTHVTDPETIAAIERNAFGDPMPMEKTETGYWVLTWTLEQYRAGQMAVMAKPEEVTFTDLPDTDEGKQS